MVPPTMGATRELARDGVDAALSALFHRAVGKPDVNQALAISFCNAGATRVPSISIARMSFACGKDAAFI